MSQPDHGSARKQRFQERLHVLHDNALHRKLKEHLPAAFNERWSRRHWIHASLFVTIGALAATIVPGFSNAIDSNLPSSHSTLALPLPPLSLARRGKTPGDSWQIQRVERGQTLSDLFAAAGVPASTMQKVLDHPGTRDVLTKLRPGAEIAFDLPVNGTLRSIRFDRDGNHRVELSLQGDQIREKVSERATSTRTVVASGEITSSLYNAARKAGLSPSAIATMTDEIFKYDIDFSKDLQPGDRFSVVMDETWREGEPMRTHKGVDYAARTGTPIMAAGDARVQFAGTQRGYGNVVILDHGSGHTTLYGHMSRLGPYRAGQRVNQGQVIGYVGSTGMSTGPHLHYEFRVNGVHRNPLSVTMPPPQPLQGADLAAFRAQTAPAMARIQGMEELIYADAGDSKQPAATQTAAAAPAAGGKRG